MEAREGLSQVIRRVANAVRPLANGHTEDVVQEALVRAMKSGVSLGAEQWLRTVARRVAIDEFRKCHESPSGGAAELERWGACDGDPEEVVIRAERSQAVREALAALPARYRRALLAYAEEESPAAVAKSLGLSASATWTLLSRARSRLRLQLEQSGFVPVVLASRGRLRELLAAGAVAGVAAAVAVHPTPGSPSRVAEPVAKVAEADAPARVETPVAPKRPAPALPVAADQIAATVDDVASKVEDTPAQVSVTACLGPVKPPDAGVGLTLLYTDERPSLLTALVQVVPSRLRTPDVDLCR